MLDRRQTCSLLTLGAALPRAFAAAARTPLRIIMAPKSPIAWVALQVLEPLYQQIGQPIAPELVPLARMSREMSQGIADGELLRIPTYFENNPHLLRVDPPFLVADANAFSLAARRLALRSREDLLRCSVGILRGNVFAEQMVAGHPNVTRAQTSPQLLRMLQSARVDAVLLHGINGHYFIKRMGMQGIEASPALARDDFHHGLAPRHQAIARQLGAAIARAVASGELARLSAKAIKDLDSVDLNALEDPDGPG